MATFGRATSKRLEEARIEGLHLDSGQKFFLVYELWCVGNAILYNMSWWNVRSETEVDFQEI